MRKTWRTTFTLGGGGSTTHLKLKDHRKCVQETISNSAKSGSWMHKRHHLRTKHQGRTLWGLPVFVILALTSLTGHAINPGCRCIRFATTFGKEWGAFVSPDFPGEYQRGNEATGEHAPSPQRGIPCLLYLFSAPVDYIVQLNFSHINLPAPQNGCHSGDYLKLFLHLDSEGVNESTPWNSLICGERSNITLWSKGRHLVIQFHAAGSAFAESRKSTGPLGFHGFFRFLNSSQFESNGRLVAGTKCDYKFESRNYSSPEGKFFSPYYPSNYPHNVMCTYMFRARLHERVKVVFESVALEAAVYSCLNKTDMIRVLDGPNSRSPVIALICNTVTDYEILSSGQELRIEFIGNSDETGMGFRAKFHFIKVIYDDFSDPYDPMRFNLQQYFPKMDIPKPVGEDGQEPQASTLVPQCDEVIHSDTARNGTFSSHGYPNPYQPKSHCRFDFIGHGRQRVQISFVDFHLFHTDEKLYIPRLHSRNSSENGDGDSKCAFSDTISAFVYMNGVRVRILEHCGLNPPPDMMSNDHRFTLEFNAKASTTTPPFRGFYAHYAFVEDFGVKTGGLQAIEYPCAFIFNISSHPNGTISSPNFPGIYPRATECHYFFHGNDEKGAVELSFDYFDIAGSYPCDKEWDDYVEWGDYSFMPTDSRFWRRCGYISSPNLRISGGGPPAKFLRLTFRSNDRWADRTGFHASFTFTRQINHVTSSTFSNGGRNVIFPNKQTTPLLLFFLGVIKVMGCLMSRLLPSS
ncbi:suppressor of lurcher protein 1-like [Folsomia candida]|uniref:suppressor of lurcher protein 1-like n=1 Tax=Folsomia candida TaxID=158441 RepID=UPI001604F290|nr:suppressor of lurcher protein 1-like [Folsomia candida]XP_035703562.1 suppressor of lurcher protein 1-like [Folsomia candida]